MLLAAELWDCQWLQTPLSSYLQSRLLKNWREAHVPADARVSSRPGALHATMDQSWAGLGEMTDNTLKTCHSDSLGNDQPQAPCLQITFICYLICPN